MSFTDRFVTLPVQMVNLKEAELLGQDKASNEDSYVKVLPMEICEYHPNIDKGHDITQVWLKSGRCFFVYLTIDEFEKVVNEQVS